jgi:transcriptional regulator with XRE-family HTH domain
VKAGQVAAAATDGAAIRFFLVLGVCKEDGLDGFHGDAPFLKVSIIDRTTSKTANFFQKEYNTRSVWKPSKRVSYRFPPFFTKPLCYDWVHKGAMNVLGQRIAAMRHHLGMSQAELAKRLGVSPSAIGMYEQGRREPSLDGIVTLCGIFGVTADYLLTGKPASRKDTRILKDSLLSAKQRAQARQLCKGEGLTTEELGVLFAAMLTEP